MRNLLTAAATRNGYYRLGISPTSVALLRCSTWGRKPAQVAAEQVFFPPLTDPWHSVSTALRALFAAADCTSRPLAVVLADQWVRLFIVTPARNTQSLQDCKAAAAMRFETLYGESASAWQINADWHATATFMACAVPTWLLTALHDLATTQRLTLLSVVPHFVAAWNQWCDTLNGAAWFGVVEDKQVSLAAISQGQLRALRRLTMPARAWRDPEWLLAECARLALIIDSSVPKALHVCGYIPDWPAEPAHVAAGCVRLDAAHIHLPHQLASAAVHLAQVPQVPQVTPTGRPG